MKLSEILRLALAIVHGKPAHIPPLRGREFGDLLDAIAILRRG